MIKPAKPSDFKLNSCWCGRPRLMNVFRACSMQKPGYVFPRDQGLSWSNMKSWVWLWEWHAVLNTWHVVYDLIKISRSRISSESLISMAPSCPKEWPSKHLNQHTAIIINHHQSSSIYQQFSCFHLRMGIKVNDSECDILVKVQSVDCQGLWQQFFWVAGGYSYVVQMAWNVCCGSWPGLTANIKNMPSRSTSKKIKFQAVDRDRKGVEHSVLQHGGVATATAKNGLKTKPVVQAALLSQGHHLRGVRRPDLWTKACSGRFTTGGSGRRINWPVPKRVGCVLIR